MSGRVLSLWKQSSLNEIRLVGGKKVLIKHDVISFYSGMYMLVKTLISFGTSNEWYVA